MRTKTLLLTAAALVAGFISAQADTVYSQNVVGYVNCTVTNGKFALIANQLDTGSNTLNNVFSAGAVSGDTQVLFWTGTTYKSFTYFNSDDSPDGGAGYYDGADQPAATNLVSLGIGVFAHNGSGGNVNLTTVGQVAQGTNNVNVVIQPGLHIYSIVDPIGGKAIDQANYPATSGQDSYLRWTGTTFQSLTYFNSDDSPDGGTGWYNGSDVNVSADPTVWPKAGESFFISHSGGAVTWTNKFVVQP